jgi:hypothetical protein
MNYVSGINAIHEIHVWYARAGFRPIPNDRSSVWQVPSSKLASPLPATLLTIEFSLKPCTLC